MSVTAGRLIVCATPIGNLGDVTLRVLNALGEVDTILAEDTRVTIRLLKRYKLSTPLERYDEFVAARRTPDFVARLGAGETLALVSDAGTPGISDPGSKLVDAALEAGIPVEVLPGPSAIVTALVASGLPTHAFYFGGFLPRKAGERKRLLDTLATIDATLIFYESPRRTADALKVLAESFPKRQGAMARELTKIHEEVVRGILPDVAAQIDERETLKGEVVLLVGPPPKGGDAAGERSEPDEVLITAKLAEAMAGGMSRSDAVKRVAMDLGVHRKLVYDLAHHR